MCNCYQVSLFNIRTFVLLNAVLYNRFFLIENAQFGKRFIHDTSNYSYPNLSFRS